MTTRRFLVLLAAGAAIGLTIFGILVSRAVTVEEAKIPEALQRFATARAALGSTPPLLTLDDSGHVARRTDPPGTSREKLNRLAALAYHANARRLVFADVPFWFFKLKGPAAQYAVRGTGLDFNRLGITAADLERYGPSIVVDHASPGGDRLLVWTE